MKKQLSLTEGPIISSLIRFALPVLLALFVQALYGGIDLLIVGQFSSTNELSGVATGSMFMHTVTMVVAGLAMGITILVGQRIGENNKEKASESVGSGIFLFIIVAIVVTLVISLFAGQLAGLLHAPQEAFNQTTNYIRICGIGFLFIVAYNVLGSIFRGIGDSTTPLITVCISCAFNIVGDLVLIAGFNLGAMGAALATVCSQGFSVLISLLIIRKKQLPFKLEMKDIRFKKEIVLRELRLGIPIALQELLIGISFLVIQAIVNNVGVNESAGVGVAEKVCVFIMLLPSSYMQSMAAFVAQNRGAGKTDRCTKALFYGIVSSMVIGIVMAVFTFFRGDLLAGIFAKDPLVIMAAHDYLRAYAIDTPLTAITFCMVGYFNGYGRTLLVMIQGLVCALFVRIPVAFIMSKIAGATLFMIGLGIPCATTVQIIICICVLIHSRKKKSA